MTLTECSRRLFTRGVYPSLIVFNLLFSAIKLQAQPEIPDAVLDIFDESCAISGCHLGTNPKKGLNLSEEKAFQALVNVRSLDAPRFLLVKPGDPENSYLIKKITGAPDIKGKRMPRRGRALTAAQIQVIADWIASLPPEAAPPAPAKEYADAFPGWTLGNIPTARTLPKGAFMYRISHRFNNPINSGFDELFGLDGGAAMMTQVVFPLSNDFSIGVGRSKINATFEVIGRLRLLREKTDGSLPVSAAFIAGVDWASAGAVFDPDNPGTRLSRTAGERFALFAQVPITKAIGPRLALVAAPGLLLNGNVAKSDEKALLTLGLGGRLAFNDKYALFAEVIPILSGAGDAAVLGLLKQNDAGRPIFYDTFTAGFEIHVGGHVFHVFVSNSSGNTTNQYLSGGNFDFLGGDMRLGFNIYRILDYPF